MLHRITRDERYIQMAQQYEQLCQKNDAAGRERLDSIYAQYRDAAIKKHRELKEKAERYIETQHQKIKQLRQTIEKIKLQHTDVTSRFQQENEQVQQIRHDLGDSAAEVAQKRQLSAAIQATRTAYQKEIVSINASLARKNQQLDAYQNQLARFELSQRQAVTSYRNVQAYFTQIDTYFKIIAARIAHQKNRQAWQALDDSVEEDTTREAVTQAFIESSERLKKLYTFLSTQCNRGYISQKITEQMCLEAAHLHQADFLQAIQRDPTSSEQTLIKDYAALIKRLKRVAEIYHELGYDADYQRVTSSVISLYNKLDQLSTSDDDRANVMLQMATYYYQAALRAKYLISTDTAVSREYFTLHQQLLKRLKIDFPGQYNYQIKQYGFLSHDEFFNYSEDNLYYVIKRSFRFWFNPGRFLKGLVDFNRATNRQALNSNMDRMSEITYKAFRGIFRRHSLLSLRHLDMGLRESYAFLSFCNFLAWLVSHSDMSGVKFQSPHLNQIILGDSHLELETLRQLVLDQCMQHVVTQLATIDVATSDAKLQSTSHLVAEAFKQAWVSVVQNVNRTALSIQAEKLNSTNKHGYDILPPVWRSSVEQAFEQQWSLLLQVKVERHLAQIFKKLLDLIQTFLCALNDEMTARAQYRDSITIRQPFSFEQNEFQSANWYQRYCLRQMTTSIVSGRHGFFHREETAVANHALSQSHRELPVRSA